MTSSELKIRRLRLEIFHRCWLRQPGRGLLTSGSRDIYDSQGLRLGGPSEADLLRVIDVAS